MVNGGIASYDLVATYKREIMASYSVARAYAFTKILQF